MIPCLRSRNPRRARRRATACLVLLALLLAALPSIAAGQSAPTPGLLVHGSGTVYGTPDVALVTLGVDVAEPQVGSALDGADAAMRAVRQVFLDAGVPATDIRTVAFNVWREDIRGSGGAVTGERYHVVHSYQVTLHDLGKLGALLSAAVTAGANDVQGVQFTIADARALQADARKAAMDDARARAEQLASAAGVTLGRPVSIDETTTPLRTAAPALAAARVGGAVPLEGGQLAVHVEVTVRYAIQ